MGISAVLIALAGNVEQVSICFETYNLFDISSSAFPRILTLLELYVVAYIKHSLNYLEIEYVYLEMIECSLDRRSLFSKVNQQDVLLIGGKLRIPVLLQNTKN